MAPSALRVSRNLHVIKFVGREGLTARAAARPGLNRAHTAQLLSGIGARLRRKGSIWPVGQAHAPDHRVRILSSAGAGRPRKQLATEVSQALLLYPSNGES